MKKIISIILVLTLVLALAGCGKPQYEENNAETAVTDAENIKEETKENSEKDKSETKPHEEKAEKGEPDFEEKTEEKTETKPETKPEAKPEEKPEEKPQDKPAEDNTASSGTVGNILLSDFKAKASSGNALSVAEALIANPIIPFMGGAVEVEPGYLTGFGNNEIKGFTEGAMFAPMIGTTPFVGYVFTLENASDAAAFAENLKSFADLRWNICTEADEMVAGISGNKVFFVMCPKSFEE